MRVLFVMAAAAMVLIAANQTFKTLDHIPSHSLIDNFGTSLQASDVSGARPMVSIALDMLKDFETWQPDAYNDPNYCTIGYGHLIALDKCEVSDLKEFAGRTLTESEGLDLLESDTAFARLAVQRLVTVDLTDNQFSALSSFVFNIGETKFGNSTLKTLLNDGHFPEAANEFGKWRKSGGVVMRGLITRRACERMLFEETPPIKNGKFDRSACQSLAAAGDDGDAIDITVGE